jgi:hypothetical protein
LFEREHHLRIAAVLGVLDETVLAKHHCFFGGGTAITLRYGEYRESIDVDFLVSDREGYRSLRVLLRGASDLSAIVRPGESLDVAREVRTDQYGIRTMVRCASVLIKLEIVNEGRIALQTPSVDDRICGLPTLVPLDMATTKLLANSDRWADRSTMNRDLIDLAMMRPPRDLLQSAIQKAEGAYGTAIRADLSKAIDAFRNDPQRVEDCIVAMRMTGTPAALLMQRVKEIAVKAGVV